MISAADRPDVAARPRHMRGADYLPSVATPVPFDVAVLTEPEFRDLASWAPGWFAAINGGEVLAAR